MSEELKACPFCGSSATIENDGFYRWAECENKNCGASAHVFAFIHDAGNASDIVANNWNTRQLEDAALKRAEAAEARAERLQAALHDIYEACYAADCDGELDSRINGDILDAARVALKGGEE